MQELGQLLAAVNLVGLLGGVICIALELGLEARSEVLRDDGKHVLVSRHRYFHAVAGRG